MIINENLLKKYILFDNDLTPSYLENLICDHITEVTKVEVLSSNTNLIIGKILKFDKITSTKQLYLVNVDIGSEILSIICGASNLKVSQKVVVAKVGSYLETMKIVINKKNIFGFISNGMICSAEELGLNLNYLSKQEKDGILFLEQDAPIGKCALEYLGLKGFSIELGLTPDRGDLLSYIGFAKDLKVIFSKNKKFSVLKNNPSFIQENEILNPFQIKITSNSCFEYHLRYLNNLKIEMSPLWLRNILWKNNIEPINNVQDVLNLVLIEYGVPLDVFDTSTFESTMIEIRNASKQEIINLNATKSYILNNEDLVISNNGRVISLIGLIDSYKNIITSRTKEIIVTSGFFEISTFFKTIKRLNIKNEKILRFTRGIDQSLVLLALERAVTLLQKFASASVCQNVISFIKTKHQNPLVCFSLEWLNNKAGIVFDIDEVKFFLTQLDYEVQICDPNNFKVRAPKRRYDVLIMEDVVSDLLRIYGYQKIQSFQQDKTKIVSGLRSTKQTLLKKIRNLLSNLGFFETITYSLVSLNTFNLFSNNSEYIEVTKPLSSERTVLRQNLSGSLIEVLSYNHKYYNFNNAFFEIGKNYHPKKETLSLSLVLSGTFLKTEWLNQDILSSFFILKGVLNKLETLLGIQIFLKSTNTYKNLHPYQQTDLFLKKEKIGFMGQLHPSVNNLYNLHDNCFVLEIVLKEDFFQSHKNFFFQEVTKLPSITRDLSFLIDKKYRFEEILKTLKEEMPFFFVKCELLDLYQNKTIANEQKSLTFRFIFNDNQKNLHKDDVSNLMKKIEEKIKKKYGAHIR